MSTGELAVAFVLLTAPPGPPELPPAADEWATVQKATQQLAVEWEILDRNETKFILANPEEFGKDLNILRKRFQELKDAPKAAAGDRFPDKSEINDRIRFNRAYRKTLENRLAYESDKAEEIRAAMCETDRLYCVWDSVRDAKCDYYYITVRRHALKKLKETLGEEAFHTGELPPNVPTWRFADLR